MNLNDYITIFMFIDYLMDSMNHMNFTKIFDIRSIMIHEKIHLGTIIHWILW